MATTFKGNRLALTGLLVLGVAAATAFVTRPAEALDDHDDRLIAIVDVVALLQEGLQAEPFAVDREAEGNAIQEQLTALQQELQALEQELRLLGPNDPSGQALFQQYQARQQAAQGQAQQANAEFEATVADDAAAIYNLIQAAADAVGGREGYRFVMMHRSEESLADLALPNLATVTQQILARPMLRGVEGNDITDLVRAELAFVAYVPEGDEDTDAGQGDGGSTPAAPPEGG